MYDIFIDVCLMRVFYFLPAAQGSVALDSSRSRTVIGTMIVSSAPRVRPRWWAEASSPMAKTSFARNAPSRSSCNRTPYPNAVDGRQSPPRHRRRQNKSITITIII